MEKFCDIDYCEVLKSVGVVGDDKEAYAILDDVKDELFKIALPKRLFAVSEVEIVDGYYRIDSGDITLTSESLNDYFYKVEKIAAVAVTLGEAIDRKIEYYGRTDALRGLYLDAMSNVYVENYLDEVETQIAALYPDMHKTMCYSCGYGDLPLSLQTKIISYLRADKLLGITVNKEFLMKPLKSVTAFIGFSKYAQKSVSPCERCSMNKTCSKKCLKALNYKESN